MAFLRRTRPPPPPDVGEVRGMWRAASRNTYVLICKEGRMSLLVSRVSQLELPEARCAEVDGHYIRDAVERHRAGAEAVMASAATTLIE